MVTHSSPRFVIFPFMSHGHTIPLLYLARLLWQRHISVTIFTTPANSPSIRASLQDTDISILDLPFPQGIPGIPPGVENTEKLPSISSFFEFAKATKLIQPHFEQALETLQPVSCIISDGFLGWTQQSATKFGIPRLVFYGMNSFSMTIVEIVVREKPHARVNSDDEPFSVPGFPRLKITRNDLEPPLNEVEPQDPFTDFMTEQRRAASESHGLLVNDFYELESSFTDYWSQKIGPKAWCVGPLCLARQQVSSQTLPKPTWVEWLDQKLAKGQPVLYVAFGTQAEVSPEQLHEIATGLEQSEVSFLWVSRVKGLEFLKGFEERVKDRGIVVKEWVNQLEILQHQSVHGYLSHCGWNSVMESICASVPILALPLMAEQHLNARMVVEEIGVGLRLMPSNGSVRGYVKSEEVKKMVKELMEGENGKEVRKKVKKVREAAWGAMKEGGSSWQTLDKIIEEICGKEMHSQPICSSWIMTPEEICGKQAHPF